jgi:uncharacterized protein (TIGR02599 family)
MDRSMPIQSTIHSGNFSRGGLLHQHPSGGFSLLELIVAVAVLALLMVLLGAVSQGTMQTVHRASGKINVYASARTIFDIMNTKLSLATLNTYFDYYDSTGQTRTASNQSNFVPTSYGRASSLQFLIQQNVQNNSYGQEVYFQCPVSYSNQSNYQSTAGLLNACGYYIQYGSNQTLLPSIISMSNSKWRYRLIQAIEPTESLQIYPNAYNDAATGWIRNIANTGLPTTQAKYALPLADNVIAMIVWPKLPAGLDSTGTTLTSNYLYDSQLNVAPVNGTQPKTANQLPPILQITLIVIDETSATRLDTHSATPPSAIENALQGSTFTSVTDYQNDLTRVTQKLIESHIDYRVINTSLVLRESKWSQ